MNFEQPNKTDENEYRRKNDNVHKPLFATPLIIRSRSIVELHH